jgi:hypothetical protein
LRDLLVRNFGREF